MGMSHLKFTNAYSNILSGRRLPCVTKQSRVYSYCNLQAIVHCTAVMHEIFQQKAMHTTAKDMTVAHCNSRIPSRIPGIRSEMLSL